MATENEITCVTSHEGIQQQYVFYNKQQCSSIFLNYYKLIIKFCFLLLDVLKCLQTR